MSIVKAFGHQHFHRISQQFVARISEQLFCARVDQHDPAALIDNHHGIGRRLQQGAELVFRAFASGDVADGADYHGTVRRLDRTQADFDRELSAIFSQPIAVPVRHPSADMRITGEVAGTMSRMLGAEARWHQHFHFLPDSSARIAEHRSLSVLASTIRPCRSTMSIASGAASSTAPKVASTVIPMVLSRVARIVYLHAKNAVSIGKGLAWAFSRPNPLSSVTGSGQF